MGHQDTSGLATATSTIPRPAPPQGIAEGAECCLRGNPYLALKNVSCEYHEGVLTLRGCLPSYYLKQMAQAAVSRVAAGARIVHQIEVRLPTGGKGEPGASAPGARARRVAVPWLRGLTPPARLSVRRQPSRRQLRVALEVPRPPQPQDAAQQHGAGHELE